MNQWSRTRKRIILSILILAVTVVVGVPLYFLFYQVPTCSDQVMNGDETGVDCGGSCQRLCTAESLPLLLKGDPRVLTVAPNVYEVVALLENPNADALISRARYVFKLYGASSLVPLKSIQGEAYVPRGGMLVLFEGPFSLEENVVPTRAVIEWDMPSLVWEKGNRAPAELVIAEKSLSRQDTTPRLEVVITNPNGEAVSNIDLTALLSDEAGSIFAASKTFIDTIPAGERAQAIFTWPRPLAQDPVEIQVVTSILPDSFLK